MPDQIDQHLIRHVVVARHETLELADRTLHVGLGELIPDVEAERAELAPVLEQRVEEARAVQQLLERLGLGLLLEVRVRVAQVHLVQVGLDAARRLDGHFDRVLQDGDGELVRGHRGEPEPVVAVHLVGVVLLDLGLKLGHP